MHDAASTGTARPALLAVPFIAQEELLCGSAAAAMVLRYWGTRQEGDAYAHLADPARGGIPTADLVDALRQDRWRALPFAGGAEVVRDHLAAGRPVIALVEARPGRYHYVVLVAWVGEQVVLHDPAIGPYQVRAEADFEQAWAAARGWGLLVLPPADGPSADGSPDAIDMPAPAPMPTPADTPTSTDIPTPADIPPSTDAQAPGDTPTSDAAAGELPPVEPHLFARPEHGDPDACAPLVAAGIDAAHAGDTVAAAARLRVAMAACPRDPAPPRELAGLYFRRQAWADATQLARRSLALDPADGYTRRLLASARFLAGDRDGALDDWNHLQEPRVDLIDVRGALRTRHAVVGRMLDLRGGDLLTRESFVRARRRLSELPAARVTALRYEPPEDGHSTVVAAVVEPPLLPQGPLAIGAAVARAAVSGEATLPLAGPAGGGAAWTPWWRWGRGRSGAGVNVALPAPAGLGALWSIDVHRYEETFAVGDEALSPAGPASPPPSGAVERTHVGLTVADWSRSDTRWQISSGWDRWRDRGAHLFFGAAVERRLAADRLALRLDGTAWTPVGARRDAFLETGFAVGWRSASGQATLPSGWHGSAGFRVVAGDAPLDLWPGAGQGELREPLLRAHPLVEDGAIRPGGVGRSLLHSTLEYRRGLVRLGPVGLSAAVFTDAAGLASPVLSADAHRRTASLNVDAGAGLRLRLPGQPGLLRLDLARGLLDGATSFSAGWMFDLRR